MKICIASGKGGTGKTTVAVNLALAAAEQGKSTAYLDCDVEEPNGHIFLQPEIKSVRPIGSPVPLVDPDLCNNCGLCGEICQYNAIVSVAKQVLVYPELCHGCGGCALVCPQGAIKEQTRQMGKLRQGKSGEILFVDGVLNVGEVMSPPLIKAVKEQAPPAEMVIFDSPPGTSCPVIETVRDSDLILLVTEPTPFGLNDLKLAVEVVRALKISFGVVINRAGFDDEETEKYCRESKIEILARIPDDKKVAQAYSRGEAAFFLLPEYKQIFMELLNQVITRGTKPGPETERVGS